MSQLGQALVRLGETEVGLITQVGDGGQSRFEPSESWANLPAGERPVLGQVFEDDPYAAHLAKTRTGVPLWFEHVLPEQDGPLRKVVANSVEVSESRGFELLCLLGKDLPGAVVVEATEETELMKTITRRVVESGDSEVRQSGLLKVSLAGVQFKLSARQGKRGIVVPAAGENGDWILKFADQRHEDLPRVEFATMRWAAASGIDTPEIQLVEIGSIQGIDDFRHIAGQYAFAIKRYDRTLDGRIHQEDFAQVLGLGSGDAKYLGTNIDTIVNVVRTIAPDDFHELISRIVFVLLSGNDDAHAKNWSLWYPGPSIPRLSPAYDQVATSAYPEYRHEGMALKLSGNREFESVGIDAFRLLAQKLGSDEDEMIGVVRSSVERQKEGWANVRSEPDIPKFVRDFIDDRLGTLPLANTV